MRKGFLIYEDMGKYFPIYEEAVCNCSTLNFLIYEENLIFFLSVCRLIVPSGFWHTLFGAEKAEKYIQHGSRIAKKAMLFCCRLNRTHPPCTLSTANKTTVY